SFIAVVDVPTSNPSSNAHVFQLSPSHTDGNAVDDGFYVYFSSEGGRLEIRQNGATGTTDYRIIRSDSFRSTYSGQRGRLEVKVIESDSSSGLEVWWQGVDITGEFGELANNPPNWLPPALDS